MAITQDVVAVNVYDDAALQRRTRTTSTGDHVRYSMTIEAEPVIHDFSIETLTARTRDAVLDTLKKAVTSIGINPTAATLRRRELAAIGLAAGVRSYVERYTGGRTSNDPPGTFKTFWNDSRRFVNGLAVMINRKESGFTVNVPANRLDPRTFGGGESALIVQWRRFLDAAPAFRGGQALLQDKGVRDAIEEDIAGSIFVASKNARDRRYKARWDLVSRIARDAGRLVLGG